MSKRQKMQFIGHVWEYREARKMDAYERKDEVDFDYYSNGQESYFQALNDLPLTTTPRVKPL